ncbi:MAG: hypothetical protein R2750_09895 [Bacteroidales bacterium]
MRTFSLLIVSIVFNSGFAFAQNEVDALRYSQTYFGGTARYMSMAGSFGALGADVSTIGSNPAGLGLFKKSEFSITPGFFIGQTKSDFNGSQRSDSRNNFNLSNFGMVLTSESGGKSNSFLKHFQFAFSYNRINNFSNRMLAEGYNNQSSIVNTYVDNANGIHYLDIEENLYGMYSYDLYPAWWTYLIDTLPGNTTLYRGAVPYGAGIYQRKELESWGSMNEYSLALGANFGDKVYLGASFAFPTIRYYEISYYNEIDVNNEIDDFRSLSIYDDLHTSGSGFNMKFGVIVRATDNIRIGGAVQSPTWYNNMKDYWYSEFRTEFDNNDVYVQGSPYGYYDYELETPWKATAGVSFILWKMALISADYEYINYTKSNLRGYDYSFYDENTTIKNLYTETHNIRVGSEVKFGYFAMRAGFGYYMSPYANNINDGERLYYTGGIGFRDKNFFVDLAYVRSSSKEDYYFYGSENVQTEPVKNHLITNNVLLTLGFRY